jgi:hypothetical protein
MILPTRDLSDVFLLHENDDPSVGGMDSIHDEINILDDDTEDVPLPSLEGPANRKRN